jgi:hypothetical protein
MLTDDYKCTGKGCDIKSRCRRFAQPSPTSTHKFAPFEQYCVVRRYWYDNEDYDEFYTLFQSKLGAS